MFAKARQSTRVRKRKKASTLLFYPAENRDRDEVVEEVTRRSHRDARRVLLDRTNVINGAISRSVYDEMFSYLLSTGT
jgi:hypothetical protein